MFMPEFSARVRGDLGPLFKMLSPEQTDRLLKRIGMGIKLRAQGNARARGGKFWNAMAASMNYQVEGGRLEVGATHVAAAQKQFGGPISAPGKGDTAKGARALTIPISPEAKGRSVGELKTRFVIFRLPGTNVLAGVRKGATRSPKKWETIPLFALVKRTKPQRPSPWFPDEADCWIEVKRAINFGAGVF